MTRSAALVAALLLALPSAGCGSGPGGDPPPRAEESAHPLPQLAPGWTAHVNPAGGFAFGLPPGWQAANRGTATAVSSLDRLVAVSISADRTEEALELSLEDFASRTLAARPGYEAPLEPREVRGFEHRYDGVVVEAGGVAKRTGVEQRVEVIVLRRAKLVTITVVIAANARPAGEPSKAIAERLVKTLRSRPVGASP